MKAIFLDRDGVINENRTDHVKSWEEFRFLPGALTALRWLRLAGFHVFVVTNQAIVERGLVSEEVIQDINARMMEQVALHGGYIQDIRYCPHDTDSGCLCRKPQPGMLLDLATQWHIDLESSYMVGDALTDIAAGRTAKCRCVMVRTGRGAEQLTLPEARQYPADHIVTDLLSAVSWLFFQENLAPSHHEGLSLMRQYAMLKRGAALPVSG